jgi:UDP-N-acetylglucosamine 2-epimerase (non-hydrolysing)
LQYHYLLISCKTRVEMVGTGYEAVLTATNRLLDDQAFYRKMAEAVNPYGDGKACRRIVSFILNRYGFPVEKMSEFKA